MTSNIRPRSVMIDSWHEMIALCYTPAVMDSTCLIRLRFAQFPRAIDRLGRSLWSGHCPRRNQTLMHIWTSSVTNAPHRSVTAAYVHDTSGLSTDYRVLACQW